MNPEAQRIAIAEACGWVREYADVQTWDASINSYKGGYKPVHTILFRRKEKCVRTENLPDYLNDLNAMHEAEKTLTYAQGGQMTMWIEHMNCAGYGPQLFATAAQRAEAFLRTLGKWEETK